LNDPEQAKIVLGEYVNYYNNIRLHSAIGYVAPLAKFNGKDKEIIAARQQKIKLAARDRRKLNESIVQ